MSSCPVSVIIPAYNAHATVAAAVQSVLDQHVPGIEVLVVDDGSTDQTAAALAPFGDAIAILRHEGGINRGVCASRRLALSVARGEFIAFLDADDAFLPGKLARHLALLRERPRVVLLHGRTETTGTVRPGSCGPADGFSMGEQTKEYDLSESPGFLDTNPICNSTVVCRRSAMDVADLPEEMIFQFEDWVLFCLLALRGKFVYDPRPLTRYSCHEGSFSYRHFRRSGSWEVAHLEYLLVLISRVSDDRIRLRAGRMIVDALIKLAQVRGAALPPDRAPASLGIDPWIASLVLDALTPATLRSRLRWQARFSAPGRWVRRHKANLLALLRKDGIKS